MEKEATHLERLLREAYSSQQEILHYNQDKKCLSVWVWPLNEAGRRISPAELGDYCEVRGIFLPYCLCPLKSKKTRAYPQASIYKPQGGTHAETYVMHCAGSEARQNCGYLVPLQHIYAQSIGSPYTEREPIQHHKFQAATHDIPFGSRYRELRRSTRRSKIPRRFLNSPPTTTVTSDLKVSNNILKRRFAILDPSDGNFCVPKFTPSSRTASETEFLLKLDDYVQPGLYEEEFRALLGRMGKCRCGMIMVQRVFKEHRCKFGLLRPIKRAKFNDLIIDLTRSDSSDSEN